MSKSEEISIAIIQSRRIKYGEREDIDDDARHLLNYCKAVERWYNVSITDIYQLFLNDDGGKKYEYTSHYSSLDLY